MPRPRKIPIAPKPDAAPVPTNPFTHPQWECHIEHSRDGLTWAASFDILGLQGWELVTVYPTWDALTAPSYHAVFKREVRA